MYYDLTKNIYRFMGGPFGLSAGVVSVLPSTKSPMEVSADSCSTQSMSEDRSKPTSPSWASCWRSSKTRTHMMARSDDHCEYSWRYSQAATWCSLFCLCACQHSPVQRKGQNEEATRAWSRHVGSHGKKSPPCAFRSLCLRCDRAHVLHINIDDGISRTPDSLWLCTWAQSSIRYSPKDSLPAPWAIYSSPLAGAIVTRDVTRVMHVCGRPIELVQG